MYTREQLEEMDMGTLALIAGCSGYQLNLDDYDLGGGFVDDKRLVDDILSKQQAIVNALPPNLLEAARTLSNVKRDFISILRLNGTEIYCLATPQEYNVYEEWCDRWEQLIGVDYKEPETFWVTDSVFGPNDYEIRSYPDVEVRVIEQKERKPKGKLYVRVERLSDSKKAWIPKRFLRDSPRHK
jgi:hypothetical protein